MRSRSNGGVIGAYALPTQNYANGVFFIHDAAIYNTGNNPIWPLGTGFIYSASGGTISTAVNDSNYKLHTFTANGTFTVTDGAAYIDIFIVGGGGPGGTGRTSTTGEYYVCGGGGAGGSVTLVESVFVNPGTTFTVEVGQGGTAATGSSSPTDGNPSRVTSNAGHSYISPGGGAGTGYLTYNSPYAASAGGGGGIRWNILQPASTRTIGSGSPGTVTSTSQSGGTALGSSTAPNTGGSAIRAGGGAGARSNGKDGSYSFILTDAGAGGDGWLYDRTNTYYGAGGGGASCGLGAGFGGHGGLSGLYPGSTTAGTGTTRSTLGASSVGVAGTNGLGGGGGGTTVYGGTTAYSQGGAGGTGTVIFCYRYQ